MFRDRMRNAIHSWKLLCDYNDRNIDIKLSKRPDSVGTPISRFEPVRTGFGPVQSVQFTGSVI